MNKKTRPTICILQETELRFKDIHNVKVKRLKKIFHTNGNQKRAEVAMLNIRQNKL